jgi:Co/Zn/Cd efflux system component
MAEDHKAAIESRLEGRLWGSVALDLAISLVEFAGAVWAGSVALLAEDQLLGEWR